VAQAQVDEAARLSVDDGRILLRGVQPQRRLHHSGSRQAGTVVKRDLQVRGRRRAAVDVVERNLVVCHVSLQRSHHHNNHHHRHRHRHRHHHRRHQHHHKRM